MPFFMAKSILESLVGRFKYLASINEFHGVYVTVPSKNIHIVDEQVGFLIVHKPVNISMHDEPEMGELGLLSLLKSQLGQAVLFPVHRLDKVTSGLVIVAKNEQANRDLSMAFQAKQVEKYYLAIARVPGGKLQKKHALKKQGRIIGDITPARNGSWKLARTYANPSVTQFLSFGLIDRYRLCVVKPLTGKTHQIRVALKSVGQPIVGDARYGGEAADRTYLHAYKLIFAFGGRQYMYTALPLTGDIFFTPECAKQLVALQEPELLPWPKP